MNRSRTVTHSGIGRRITCWALVLGQLLGSVTFAAQTDISDVPLPIKSRVQPNMIIGLDDSGSMDSEVLMPTNDGALWWHTGDMRFFGRNQSDTSDYNSTTKTGTINFNSAGTASSTWKKYVNLFPNGTAAGARIYADSTDDHFAVPPTPEFAWLRSPDYNPLYFNPTRTYTPWPASNNGTANVTYPNQTATAASSNPGVSGAPTFDLTVTRSTLVANNAFRMFTGMTIPKDAQYCDVNSNIPSVANCAADGSSYATAGADYVIGTSGQTPAGVYYVNVPYTPGVYYLKDPTGTDAVGPDGATLKRYTVTAAQMQNFANWFSYYRKRKLLMNSSMGAVFQNLRNIRMGMVRFNSNSNATMYNFSDTDNTKNARRLLNIIYGVNGSGGTPTRVTLDYIGQQYKRMDADAPITQACQFNSAFIVTDGYATVNNPATVPDNADKDSVWSKQYGNTNTFPYTDETANTLADIAMKYYGITASDALRTDTGFPLGKVPVNPQDTGPDADRNPNLHMNTYAMGLGVKGLIFGTGSAAATNPYTTAPDWDTVVNGYPDRSPRSVDDLWHATINGRGDMVSASDPASVQAAIQLIVANVLAKVGAAAAVAVSNANVTSTDNASFSTSFNSGNWTGDLESFPIDLVTGQPSSTRTWSAKQKLDALSPNAATSRKIATAKDNNAVGPTGNGITFQSASLSAAQLALLNTPSVTPVDGVDVLAFLRGDRSKEGSTYRLRGSLVPDFINSEPVFVRAPARSYIDAGYSAFKTLNAGRAQIVYQGGNGGMLHAFNAATGVEQWAYVPNLVMGSLNNLTKKDGFEHRYYVDATPVSSDVDFANTASGSGASDWRTLLVGGLGKGGRGYFALDVTDPAAASDSAVASKVLWEFPNSSMTALKAKNVGFTYGRPVIVKTEAKGWVVIVTSGYNNGTDTGGSGGDGGGYLWVLDARTGEVIKEIATGVGSATDPSGLSKISAFVEASDVDNTVKYVYGGDLKGNFWRFDLKGNNANSWNVKKLATAVTSGGAFQPITVEPEIGEVNNKPFLLFGTGLYVGDTDIPGSTGANAHSSQTQTMYGLLDDETNTPLISPLRTNLQQQTLSAGATSRTSSNNTVDYTVKRGWYVDLPETGERSVTDPALALGVLVFTSNIPNTDPCSPGGRSFIYTISYRTGGAVTLPNGTVITQTGTSLGDSLSSRPTIIKLPSGEVKAIVRKSDATTTAVTVPTSPGLGAAKRINWKEIFDK